MARKQAPTAELNFATPEAAREFLASRWTGERGVALMAAAELAAEAPPGARDVDEVAP